MVVVVFIEIFGNFHFMRFVMVWQWFHSSPSFLTPRMQNTVSKRFQSLSQTVWLGLFRKIFKWCIKRNKYDATQQYISPVSHRILLMKQKRGSK